MGLFVMPTAIAPNVQVVSVLPPQVIDHKLASLLLGHEHILLAAYASLALNGLSSKTAPPPATTGASTSTSNLTRKPGDSGSAQTK